MIHENFKNFGILVYLEGYFVGIKKWSEEKIHKLTIWDIAIVKIALIIFGILIGAYISIFVKQYLWYFVGAFVVLYAILLYRLFEKK